MDNAREPVDSEGVIHGLKLIRMRPNKLEDVLLLAAHAHPAILAMFAAGKIVLSKTIKPEIDYGPGVEMTVRLRAPIELPGVGLARAATRPMAPPELAALANGQRFVLRRGVSGFHSLGDRPRPAA